MLRLKLNARQEGTLGNKSLKDFPDQEKVQWEPGSRFKTAAEIMKKEVSKRSRSPVRRSSFTSLLPSFSPTNKQKCNSSCAASTALVWYFSPYPETARPWLSPCSSFSHSEKGRELSRFVSRLSHCVNVSNFFTFHIRELLGKPRESLLQGLIPKGENWCDCIKCIAFFSWELMFALSMRGISWMLWNSSFCVRLSSLTQGF